MYTFRLLLLAGSLLALSFGSYAVIHAMNPDLRSATDETSHRQTKTSRSEEARTGVASGGETISPAAPAKGLELTDVTKTARIEDVRALWTEVVRLRGVVVALETRLAVVEQPDSRESYASYTDDDGDMAPLGPDEVPSQAERNEQAYQRIEVMDVEFRAEVVDGRWSPEATDLIREAFEREELAGTDVYDMQCRSTLCRLEVEH